MYITKEHFNSIHEMLNIIKKRTNNPHMKDCDSSETGSKNFTGTKDFHEAENLFQYGYKDVLDKIKTGVAKSNVMRPENRRRVTTGTVGYAPHVPNAILGLPNSMIYTEKQTQKVKAISIIYDIGANCSMSTDEFIESGISVLNVINRLELQGVRVNLKIMFMCCEGSNEHCFVTVDVKDYREHMDIQKLCFPIAHPSMFRRFGFKWLETVPTMKTDGFQFGYGHHVGENDKELKKMIGENEFFLNLNITKKLGYNADKIIESMKI